MTGGRTRYPGAQPFSDEAISRAVFFGRAKESAALADQILANRLLVVYAKSGLGKTSLLQAGVAQPLREEGHLPLFVRVNDVKRAPMRRILDGVRDSAVRQKVEYHPGSELSLWHFFKTAEFWLADRLLTPVLILDQFEELFTLHGTEARAGFLREFGHLVRGVRPELELERESTSRGEAPLTDTPPAMRIVISLREDYLGSLEEAADSIPQILDHRFRLKPLAVQDALDALEGPATVKDERLATQPFTYRPDTVQAILAYLSRRTRGTAVRGGDYVEPFHLQLICQRAEALVAKRQRQGAQQVEIVIEDLGGEPGLKATLRDFYKNVIGAIEVTRTRKKVRRLCEQYLISPEGRRLSLERGEIKRIVKLGADTLGDLVDRRLLRSDQRADSWYYELSHDSLVAPILATRKTQGIAFGVLGLLGSLIGCVFAFSLVGIVPMLMYFASFVPPERGATPGPALLIIGGLLFLSLGALLFWISITGLRRSVEALNRYTSPPST
jgi:hypothetical protein